MLLPYSNHATLQSLLDHFEELHSEESSGNVPSLLCIEEGEYVVKEGAKEGLRRGEETTFNLWCRT